MKKLTWKTIESGQNVIVIDATYRPMNTSDTEFWEYQLRALPVNPYPYKQLSDICPTYDNVDTIIELPMNSELTILEKVSLWGTKMIIFRYNESVYVTWLGQFTCFTRLTD